MTVQEVYNLFSRHKKDVSDVSSQLFFDWCDEINLFAYRLIYGSDPERFISENAISVITGDATYSLPVNFLNMQPKGCGIFETDNGVRSDRRLTITGYGSSDHGYFINGSTVNLTPTPQASTTLYLRYIPALATIDAMADTLVIPDEYIYYVKNAVDVLYNIWDEDVSAESVSDQRFIRAMDELARNINQDSKTVGIKTYSNAYY